MAFSREKHNSSLYSILLILSRNKFFYDKIKLPDTFETRIYLMFIHFSIFMIISRKKKVKFEQKSYDNLFFHIENDLRELGFGDVSVNKKMKEFNKILYDILLKLESPNKENNHFEINQVLVTRYFEVLNNTKNTEYVNFKTYFNNFYNFCFELPLENMVEDAIKFI